MKKIILLSSFYWLALNMALAPVTASDAQHPASQEAAAGVIAQARAVGTGRTTGVIATVTLVNSTDFPIEILPQTLYLPSNGKYQDYIGRIAPGTVIAAGESATVPVEGYCADVHSLPVPDGEAMPPLSSWVPVGQAPATISSASGAVQMALASAETVPAFKSADIDGIMTSSVFTRGATEGSDIIVHWPGTEVALSGTLDPGADPLLVAPVMVRALEAIEEAAARLQQSQQVLTPFAGNPTKELEAIIQQTLWIYMGALSGETYRKADFAQTMQKQYESNSGTAISAIPKEDREKLDKGVDAFWDAFTATGVEAKVLRMAEPETAKDEAPVPVQQTPSVPVAACNCSSCTVTSPIRIINTDTGAAITADSIPTYIDQLQVYPLQVQSDCSAACSAENVTELRITSRFDFTGSASTPWSSNPADQSVTGAGVMNVESRYRCHCDGASCGTGNESRRLRFIESNDCCDQIRRSNGGRLQFGFSGGNILLAGNQMTLSMASGGSETFSFDFNLEAIFCNLGDNQIFAQLQTLASQHSAGSSINEFLDSQDISLDHPTDISDTRPWYSLTFSKSVNGREIAINITIDESTCAIDVQVLNNNQLYERAAPPFISPDTLTAMGISLGDHKNRRFWHRALTVIGQLLRAQQYGQQSAYMTTYLNFLSRLKIAVESLQHDPAYSAMHADLARLHALLVQGMTTRDFDLVEQISNELLNVFNQMWG